MTASDLDRLAACVARLLAAWWRQQQAKGASGADD